jgi:hypothetical protein
MNEDKGEQVDFPVEDCDRGSIFKRSSTNRLNQSRKENG